METNIVIRVYSRGTVARLGLITSIHCTFNKLALSEQRHAGIVCASVGGHSKANGGWRHLWPRPSSCPPASLSPPTPSSQVMLRKCQAEKKEKTQNKKGGGTQAGLCERWAEPSWAERGAVLAPSAALAVTADGGCDTWRQWLHTAIWSALRHCHKAAGMAAGMAAWRALR